MSLVERIDTICLTVRNVEEASRWYQEVLGFQEFF
ncbi:MAG TPA: VOC family protein [Bacillota bacterium]|nr:VOC family protein [Bacillota bacterium]